MKEFNGKGVKQHFAVGVAFYVVSSLVQLLNNGLLLVNIGQFIEPDGKIKYFAQINKGNKGLALSVSQKGKANIYARMPQ